MGEAEVAMRGCLTYGAAALIAISWVPPSHAQTAAIPERLLPSVKCIYSLLKSSPAVRSVDVYAIDDFRLGFEYTFTGTDGQPAVSYEELLPLANGSAFLGDKIPREVTEHAMMEGSDLTSNLHLAQKCHLQEGFDNLYPQPPARVTWRRIDLPKDFH
jgi:hypothetical protein